MKRLFKFFSIFLLLSFLTAGLISAVWARDDSFGNSAGAYDAFNSKPDHIYTDQGVNTTQDYGVNDYNPAPVSDVGTSIAAYAVDNYSNMVDSANIDTSNILSSATFPYNGLSADTVDSAADILNNPLINDPFSEARNSALLADNSLVPRTIKNKGVREETP